MNSKLRSISPLSHSKTVSFSSCKKKFSYSYLVGIKDTSGIHAEIGTFVHKVIEDFYNSQSNNPFIEISPLGSNELTFLHDDFEKNWEKDGERIEKLFTKEKDKVKFNFENAKAWAKTIAINYEELEKWIQDPNNNTVDSSLKFNTTSENIKDLKVKTEEYVSEKSSSFTTSRRLIQLKQETLLFRPTVPISGALKTVIAFPNTYQIGITSLGYQIIWATLAQRSDVDVRRLFTDQGDKPHRNTDLFGLSLSWELDGPILLNLLEENSINSNLKNIRNRYLRSFIVTNLLANFTAYFFIDWLESGVVILS